MGMTRAPRNAGLKHLVCVVGLKYMFVERLHKQSGVASVLYAWMSGQGTGSGNHISSSSMVMQPSGLAIAASVVGVGSMLVSLLGTVVLVRTALRRNFYFFCLCSLATHQSCFIARPKSAFRIALSQVVPNDADPLLAWILVYEWTLLGEREGERASVFVRKRDRQRVKKRQRNA